MAKKISHFLAIDYRVVAYCLVFVFIEEIIDITISTTYAQNPANRQVYLAMNDDEEPIWETSKNG